VPFCVAPAFVVYSKDELFFRHEVVVCLSEVVRNDTLLEAPVPRIGSECRQQLRFELLAETENVMKLNPKLAKDCGDDVRKYCPKVQSRDGEVAVLFNRSFLLFTRACG